MDGYEVYKSGAGVVGVFPETPESVIDPVEIDEQREADDVCKEC